MVFRVEPHVDAAKCEVDAVACRRLVEESGECGEQHVPGLGLGLGLG